MRHKWDINEQRLASDCFDDGCGRTIRVCEKCGMRKITVHPPQAGEWPFREWQTADGKTTWRSEMTPPCVRAANVVDVRKRA
jgi:hypothetical protein